MGHLRLPGGEGFKSHTFQVIFNPLKCIKAAINEKTIKLYLTNCSEEDSGTQRFSKKQDSPSEGVPIIVHVLRNFFNYFDMPSFYIVFHKIHLVTLKDLFLCKDKIFELYIIPTF